LPAGRELSRHGLAEFADKRLLPALEAPDRYLPHEKGVLTP
jgi:hypothetical protein